MASCCCEPLNQTNTSCFPARQQQQELGSPLLILLGIPVTGVQHPAPRPCVRCFTLPEQTGAAPARLFQPVERCSSSGKLHTSRRNQAEGNPSSLLGGGEVIQRNTSHSRRSISLQRAQSSLCAGVTQPCILIAWDSQSQKPLWCLRVPRRGGGAPKSDFHQGRGTESLSSSSKCCPRVELPVGCSHLICTDCFGNVILSHCEMQRPKENFLEAEAQ